MSEIRACARDDMPAVAALFHKIFRNGEAAASKAVEAYFTDLFLDHPAYDPDLGPRVHVADHGRVDGFIGVFPQRMRVGGRTLMAAVAGSLMVDDPKASPLVGARLVKAYFSGPQDLSVTESANPVAQRMWTALGARPLPPYSMEWLRVFAPVATAVAIAAHFAPALAVLRPLAMLADALAGRFASALRLDARAPGATRAADVDEREIADLLPQFAGRYGLHPDWTAAELNWMLSHARRKEAYGPLHRRVVYGRGDVPVGCYLHYGRPHGIAHVLQVLAQPAALEAVIDDLLNHAAALGCAAVRGRTQPELLDPLLRRRAIMLHRATTLVHTRDAEVRAAIAVGDAVLVGFAAESWSRLIGGRFG